MGRTLLLSIGQLGDRVVLRVLARSLAVTLVLFAGLGTGAWYGIDALLAALWNGADASGLAAIIAVALTIGAGWLLFRMVAIAVIGIFADDVVEAVERRHYPDARRTARPVGTVRSLGMGLRSAGRALVVNLLILPIYLLLLVTGFGTPLLFLVANGWLLGRDLGDMVAVRHLPRTALPDWRRDTRIPRFVLGLGIATLFLVPVAGLIAPVLGTAMATHLFHRRRS